jgi:hypothetical protein
VARAYFSTIEASQQEANARETLGLYEDYLKLTDVRKQQGHASDFELAQVKSRTASARDTLITAQSARAQADSRYRGRHQPVPCRQTRRAPFLPQPAGRRARRLARPDPRAPT